MNRRKTGSLDDWLAERLLNQTWT